MSHACENPRCISKHGGSCLCTYVDLDNRHPQGRTQVSKVKVALEKSLKVIEDEYDAIQAKVDALQHEQYVLEGIKEELDVALEDL